MSKLQHILGLMALAAALACEGSTKAASTGGGTSSGGGAPVRLDAGASHTFTSISLAASGGEAELLLAQTEPIGYQVLLQHLSPSGAGVGSLVLVAMTDPNSPPHVAVDSNGPEVACCWEDFGLNPNTFSLETRGALVLCNSVPLGGTMPDDAMDGGFIDLGYLPAVANNGQGTIVAYSQVGNRGVLQEILYEPWGTGVEYPAPFLVLDWQVALAAGGFQVVMYDGESLSFGHEALNLRSDGGLQSVPSSATSSGTFALAPSPPLTAVLLHQGSSVGATVIGGSSSALTGISAPSEQPLDPLAAATCDPNTFGFAYALDGGDVMFRAMTTAGAAVGGSSTLVANLGPDVIGLGMAAVDGGVLIAAGTPTAISVYSVPCP